MSERVVYVLDYFGKTLVGTTEVLQETYESPTCSDEERTFLIGIFNHHFKHQIAPSDIVREYAGLRPILRRNKERTRVITPKQAENQRLRLRVV